MLFKLYFFNLALCYNSAWFTLRLFLTITYQQSYFCLQLSLYYSTQNLEEWINTLVHLQMVFFTVQTNVAKSINLNKLSVYICDMSAVWNPSFTVKNVTNILNNLSASKLIKWMYTSMYFNIHNISALCSIIITIS